MTLMIDLKLSLNWKPGYAKNLRIVHRHAGRIRTEGVRGQGATFTFTLA